MTTSWCASDGDTPFVVVVVVVVLVVVLAWVLLSLAPFRGDPVAMASLTRSCLLNIAFADSKS